MKKKNVCARHTASKSATTVGIVGFQILNVYTPVGNRAKYVVPTGEDNMRTTRISARFEERLIMQFNRFVKRTKPKTKTAVVLSVGARVTKAQSRSSTPPSPLGPSPQTRLAISLNQPQGSLESKRAVRLRPSRVRDTGRACGKVQRAGMCHHDRHTVRIATLHATKSCSCSSCSSSPRVTAPAECR